MIGSDGLRPTAQARMQFRQEAGRILRVGGRIECLIQTGERRWVMLQVDLKATHVDIPDAALLERTRLLESGFLGFIQLRLTGRVDRPG